MSRRTRGLRDTYAAAVDSARLGQMRHLIFGDPAPASAARDEPAAGRVSYGELRAAMPLDPAAFRAFWRVMGMIATPEEVYTDPEVVARTRDVLSRRGDGPPVAAPTRDQLAALLSP